MQAQLRRQPHAMAAPVPPSQRWQMRPRRQLVRQRHLLHQSRNVRASSLAVAHPQPQLEEPFNTTTRPPRQTLRLPPLGRGASRTGGAQETPSSLIVTLGGRGPDRRRQWHPLRIDGAA